MKRILSFMLVSMMMLTMILPVGATTPTIPAVGTMVYSTDFSDNAIDSTHFSGIRTYGDGSVTQENGKLHLYEEGSDSGVGTYASRTSVDVYPYSNDITSVLSGKFVVEYTWEKADPWWAAEVFLFGSASVNEESGSEFIRLMSYKNAGEADNAASHTAKMYVAYSDTAGGKGPDEYRYTDPTQFDMNTTIKMTIAVDTNNHTLDLWINDIFAESFTDLQLSGLQRIQFDTYGHDERESDITVDDLRIYTVAAGGSSSADAEADFEALSRRSLLTAGSADATLLDNLNLPTEGANGSTITWSSSDPAVINPANGVVTRPALTKSVTITATIDGSLTKAFSFRVPGKEVAIGGTKTMPTKGTVIYENNFDGTTVDAAHISMSSVNVAQNDALQMTRELYSGTEVSATIYPKSQDHVLSGEVVYEFYVDKYAKEHGAFIRFDGLSLNSWSYGTGLIITDADGDKPAIPYDSFGMNSGLLKVTAAFDTNADTYDLWINNEYVSSGRYTGAARSVQFSTGGDRSISGTHSVDNFSVYYTGNVSTFYSDTFNGSSLPDSVIAANGATLDTTEQSIKAPAGNYTVLKLNPAGTDITGKVVVDFTLARNAYNANTSFRIQDSNGRNVMNAIWYQAAGSTAADIYTGMSVRVGDGNGGEKIVRLANSSPQTTTKVLMQVEVDTNTGSVTVWANLNGRVESVSGTLHNAAASGVAKLNFEDNGGSGTFRLLDVNCYGVGSYTREEKTSLYSDSFEGTTVPTLAGGAATNPGGALVPNQQFALDINSTTGEANGIVTVEFTVWRKGYQAATSEIYIRDAADNAWAYLQWTGYNVGYGVRTHFRATQDAASDYTTSSASASDAAKTFKVEINTTNGALKVWDGSTLLANGYSPSANASGGVEKLFISGGNIVELRDVNSSQVTLETISTPTYVPETAPEVSAMAIDYNAFDKKVNILSPDAKDLTVIAAAYAVNGANKTLISAVPADVTLVADGSVVADTSALSTAGANSVVIYLWSDATSTLQPVCAAVPAAVATAY